MGVNYTNLEKILHGSGWPQFAQQQGINVCEWEELTSLYSQLVFPSLEDKKKLLPPAGANKTAGSMYGKIEKEKKLRSWGGTLVVKVNVWRGEG